ncbi:hypothetical protein [Streptomyces sp. NBC_00620]|uniref:hypothetical protein n=1 Tax=Streptomyces sp. NBC_00620 TaxID=2903666 RepID=UPI002254ACF5|nr:hypothetical protein [Streptomyces sp. NBC_00620]MCX4974219.1 hypothetical protein [Streptomyces sp. NBC_00620]
MTRIRVLEAIAGSDFSWAPGDVVEVSAKEAASWADGHRAVLADDGQEPDAGKPVREMAMPRVVTVDGLELEVLEAGVEEIDPPPGREDETWGQWVVTIALPAPADPDSDLTVPAVTEEPPATDGDGVQDADNLVPVQLPFDPSEHSNREVLAYLDTVGEEEALRVLDEEAAGENRAGIRKNRDAVIEAARLRDPAPRSQPDAAEVAADDSRGGGRGEQPETRDW